MKDPSDTTVLPVCKGAETDRDDYSADEEAAHILLQLNGRGYLWLQSKRKLLQHLSTPFNRPFVLIKV